MAVITQCPVCGQPVRVRRDDEGMTRMVLEHDSAVAQVERLTDQLAGAVEALEKLRLHGSQWWRDEWGTPSHVANEALNAADLGGR